MGADFECLMRIKDLDTSALADVFKVCGRALELSPRIADELLIYGDDPIVPLRATSLRREHEIDSVGVSKIIGLYSIALPNDSSLCEMSLTLFPSFSALLFAIDENLVFGFPCREPPYGQQFLGRLFSAWQVIVNELPVVGVRYGTEGGPAEDLTPSEWAAFWDPKMAFSDERNKSSYFQAYWK